MKNYCFFLLFFVGLTASAQVKGVVRDSISGLPVPYVSIAVLNENLWATSEENGEFTIDISGKSKFLVFSALGFGRKTVAIAQAAEVKLKPTALELDEVVISRRRETRQKEIGRNDNQIYEAFENAPRIDLKFFPYRPDYQKTKYIKQVAFVTDSKINDASFKIHFYKVGADGYPGEELTGRDFIVSVDKGQARTKFNVSKLNLQMPKEGIFIGFEKLLIAANKVEKTVTDPVSKQTQTRITHQPMVLYEYVDRDFQFVYQGGQWTRKKSNPNPDGASAKIRINEPAITLILTN